MVNYDNLAPCQSYFHSDDDVDSDDEVVLSEGQRATYGAQRPKPPFKIPKHPPKQWNPQQMIRRIQVGMMVELSTIPLYLYAMYSVKSGSQARNRLRNILEQEMLHLALAGNLLSALGGSLDLYDFDVVPRYPGHILMDKIPMTLRPLDNDSLSNFIRIESPSVPRPQAFVAMAEEDIGILTQDYKSIGDLYEDVIKGIEELTDKDFSNNPDCQFSGNDFFGDELSIITNKVVAVKAMNLIIEQGEGNTDSDDSHFHAFSELRETLQSNPSAWEVRPVPEDPQTAKYDSGSFTHKLSLAFDAAYCYLLQTIQRVWRQNEKGVREVLIENIGTIMRDVLTPLAEILVQLPLGNGVAAPCFNYYAMVGDVGAGLVDNKDPLTPEELHKQLSNRMKDALNAAPDAHKRMLERISGDVNNMTPS